MDLAFEWLETQSLSQLPDILALVACSVCPPPLPSFPRLLVRLALKSMSFLLSTPVRGQDPAPHFTCVFFKPEGDGKLGKKTECCNGRV